MGQQASATTSAPPTPNDACTLPSSSGPVGPDGKKLKPCCACPETKKVRDECILMRGEEECADAIEAHKQCMRALGFKV